MITLEQAREIAYSWHGGGGSPLYSFASTSGHGKPENITPDTVREAQSALWNYSTSDDESGELGGLIDFLSANLPAQPEEDYDTCPTLAWCPYCDESVYDTQTANACVDCQKRIDESIAAYERDQP